MHNPHTAPFQLANYQSCNRTDDFVLNCELKENLSDNRVLVMYAKVDLDQSNVMVQVVVKWVGHGRDGLIP